MPVVVKQQDSAGLHSAIEELAGRLDCGIDVEIDVDEGKGPVPHACERFRHQSRHANRIFVFRKVSPKPATIPFRQPPEDDGQYCA